MTRDEGRDGEAAPGGPMEDLNRIWLGPDGTKDKGLKKVIEMYAFKRLEDLGVPSARTEAEDICSETYKKMLEKKQAKVDVRDPAALATTIAGGLILDARRGITSRPVPPRPLSGGEALEAPTAGPRYVPLDAIPLDALPGSAPSVEDEVIWRAFKDWFIRQLGVLTRREQQVLIGRYDGLMPKEISELYDIKPNGISQNRKRAEGKLRSRGAHAWWKAIPGVALILWWLRSAWDKGRRGARGTQPGAAKAAAVPVSVPGGRGNATRSTPAPGAPPASQGLRASHTTRTLAGGGSAVARVLTAAATAVAAGAIAGDVAAGTRTPPQAAGPQPPLAVASPLPGTPPPSIAGSAPASRVPRPSPPTPRLISTPTGSPTAIPSVTPTSSPTATPTSTPTATPTSTPTATPTAAPTLDPARTWAMQFVPGNFVMGQPGDTQHYTVVLSRLPDSECTSEVPAPCYGGTWYHREANRNEDYVLMHVSATPSGWTLVATAPDTGIGVQHYQGTSPQTATPDFTGTWYADNGIKRSTATFSLYPG